jgi:hypothetical protein
VDLDKMVIMYSLKYQVKMGLMAELRREWLWQSPQGHHRQKQNPHILLRHWFPKIMKSVFVFSVIVGNNKKIAKIKICYW